MGRRVLNGLIAGVVGLVLGASGAMAQTPVG
jgi:hypothetical protein